MNAVAVERTKFQLCYVFTKAYSLHALSVTVILGCSL